jgi:hypothetical protein
MASWANALRRLDEAIDVADRQRRAAGGAGNEQLRRKMRDLVDELEALKRELVSLKSQFDR